VIALIYTDQKSSIKPFELINPCHPCSSVVRFAFCASKGVIQNDRSKS
jgi:hypothetical protein